MKITDLTSPNHPTMFVPIGPSGCGKSTLYKRLKAKSSDLRCFSLDELRLKWYNPDDYRDAWEKASKDRGFKQRANDEFARMVKDRKDLYVDGTNLSPKKRKEFLKQAKKHEYKTVALTFNVDVETLMARQKTRGDKNVPEKAVTDQVRAYTKPVSGDGEFDVVKRVESLV